MSKVKKVILGVASFLTVCYGILEKVQKSIQIAVEMKAKAADMVQYGKDVAAIWRDVFGKKAAPCAGTA